VLRAAGKRGGWSVATQAYQPVAGAEQVAAEYGASREDVFLDAAEGDDWVGVQAYTRTRIGPEGPLPIPDDAERTLTGWEYYPPAVGDGIRNAWARAGVPVYVTENGMATQDDVRRIDYTTGALETVAACIAEGVDVRGYLHWSALDNYEPSLAWLGGVARRNGL
jgi:beta-glucosidase